MFPHEGFLGFHLEDFPLNRETNILQNKKTKSDFLSQNKKNTLLKSADTHDYYLR